MMDVVGYFYPDGWGGIFFDKAGGTELSSTFWDLFFEFWE